MYPGCSGTVHDEYACGWGQVCCEAVDAGPEPDAGSDCPWSCEGYTSCDGIGHTEYDCGYTNICCEPAPADAGTGDCVDEGYTCETAYTLCDGDPIHFETSGCEMWELCCG
jgi:hypothetical protein